MIIDFHTHTFPDKISSNVLAKLSSSSHTKNFTEGSVQDLLESMQRASVDYSVNLPVMTNVGQVEKVNSALIAARDTLLEQGIITFGGIHPDYENYKQELRRLKENHIPGIKLHPAYQNTDFDDPRMMRILDQASELGLIVLTHAGIDVGIHDRNYASVGQILRVINTVHPEKLVLAHMGGWGCWEEVERDLAGAPVWLDTAFSIGPITPSSDIPPIRTANLSDSDFVRLARKHGTDRILFATDSPWEDQQDYVRRFRRTLLTASEKARILSKNAEKLLGLPSTFELHSGSPESIYPDPAD